MNKLGLACAALLVVACSANEWVSIGRNAPDAAGSTPASEGGTSTDTSTSMGGEAATGPDGGVEGEFDASSETAAIDGALSGDASIDGALSGDASIDGPEAPMDATADASIDGPPDDAGDGGGATSPPQKACSVDGWCWSNPLPQGNTLNAVWGYAANDVWAVGGGGSILHFGGASWSGVRTVTSTYLRGVWGSSPVDTWAVGNGGTIVHWDGTSWSHLGTGTTSVDLMDVWGSGGADAWAVGNTYPTPQSTVAKTAVLHWNGSAWSAVDTGAGVPLTAPSGVWASSPTDVWISQYQSVLHWDGANWTAPVQDQYMRFYSVRGTGPTDVWVPGIWQDDVQYHYEVRHWDGSTWTTTQLGTRSFLTVVPIAQNDVWSADVLAHYDGTTWMAATASEPSIYGLWFLNKSEGWGVGVNGALLHWDGAAWSPPPSQGPGVSIQSLWGTSSSDLWGVGAGTKDNNTVAQVLHFDGTAWSISPTPVSPTYLMNVWGTGTNDVWTVGADGLVLHWDGVSWSQVANATSYYMTKAWWSSPSDAWAVGSWSSGMARGSILHWDGSSWSPASGDPSSDATLVSGSGADDVWVAGHAANVLTVPGVLFHWDGAAWTTTLIGGYTVTGLFCHTNKDAWVATQEGVIFHWDGVEWLPWGDPAGRYIGMMWGSESGDVWASMSGASGTIDVIHARDGSWVHSSTGSLQAINAAWSNGTDNWIAGYAGAVLVRSNPIEQGDAGAVPPSDAASSDADSDGNSVRAVQVSVGYQDSCTVWSDGSVTCDGVLKPWPKEKTFIQVAAGGPWGDYGFACGLHADGTLVCWGNGPDGETTPPAGTFKQVSTGFSHACGLQDDGTIACWGNNDYGQATPPAGSFVEVSANGSHTCGLAMDGTVACWGAGVGSPSAPDGQFRHISAGGGDTCGQRLDNTVTCWSSDGTTEKNVPPGSFLQITAGIQLGGGTSIGCGLRSNGRVVCWGDWYGTNLNTNPPSVTFTQISQGYERGCGVTTQGTVICWSGSDPTGGG